MSDGEQVAGELDAVEGPADRAGQRPRQRGLADAGHVLDEQVAAREQRDDRVADRGRFAAEHPRDVRLQRRHQLCRRGRDRSRGMAVVLIVLANYNTPPRR